jgi:hypothetical protein
MGAPLEPVVRPASSRPGSAAPAPAARARRHAAVRRTVFPGSGAEALSRRAAEDSLAPARDSIEEIPSPDRLTVEQLVVLGEVQRIDALTAAQGWLDALAGLDLADPESAADVLAHALLSVARSGEQVLRLARGLELYRLRGMP